MRAISRKLLLQIFARNSSTFITLIHLKDKKYNSVIIYGAEYERNFKL